QSKTNGRASTTPPRKRPMTRPATRQGEERNVREGSRVRRVSSTTRLSSRSASPSRAVTPGRSAKDVIPAQPIAEETVAVPKQEVVAQATASQEKPVDVAPLAAQAEENNQKTDAVSHATERAQTPAADDIKEDIKQ